MLLFHVIAVLTSTYCVQPYQMFLRSPDALNHTAVLKHPNLNICHWKKKNPTDWLISMTCCCGHWWFSVLCLLASKNDTILSLIIFSSNLFNADVKLIVRQWMACFLSPFLKTGVMLTYFHARYWHIKIVVSSDLLVVFHILLAPWKRRHLFCVLHSLFFRSAS